MKKKNDKNDIIIEELGGACIGVTGSCTLVSYYNEELDERRNIIFEMGLIQKEQDPYKLYIDNQKMLQGITKEMIDNMLVMRASNRNKVQDMADKFPKDCVFTADKKAWSIPCDIALPRAFQ